MDTNTIIGWEPSAAEATYLYDRIRGYGNLFATTGDMPLCIRIMSEFRAQFAATHREPPMEYVLNLLREYKNSLFTAHSGVGPNFGPNHNSGHFVNDTLHHSQIDFSLFQDYTPQDQHSLDLNTPSFGNHPPGLDLHTNYAGYIDVNMPFPKPPAQSDVQNDGPTMDLQVDEHSESTEPIGDDAKIKSITKTSHKTKGERNVFYGARATAAILYAKQDIQINARVDARLKSQPELLRERVRILAEERLKAWKDLTPEDQAHWTTEADKVNNQCPDLGSVKEKLKLLTSKLFPLQTHALEALSFPIASIVFTPASGMEQAKANIIYVGPENQQSFTDWLGDTYGDEKLAEFMEHIDAFAKVVHKSANTVVHTSEYRKDPRVVGRSVSKKEDPLGAYWKGGLSTIPDPSTLGTPELRRIFRAALVERWNESGYSGKVVPWQRIRDKPHNFIQPEFLEEGSVEIKQPEGYDTDTLRKMVRLFFDHQEGTLAYDRGLVFLPCGTGSELYYPTKKVKGKGRARAATPAFDATPDFDTAMTPTIDAATTPAFDAAMTPAIDNAAPSPSTAVATITTAVDTAPPTTNVISTTKDIAAATATMTTDAANTTDAMPANDLNNEEQERREQDPYHKDAADTTMDFSRLPTMTFKHVPIHKRKPSSLPPAATNTTTSSPAPTTAAIESSPAMAISTEDAATAASTNDTTTGASAIHNSVMPPPTTTTAPLPTSPSIVPAHPRTLMMPPHRSVLAIMHDAPDVPPTDVSVTHTTDIPTALLKEKARRKKKGSKAADGAVGPPAPPVPTRTLRGASKRSAEQAALEDSGSLTSTRPQKTQRSE